MSLSDIRNLDYIVLLCQDMARMRDFYSQVMGFKVDQHELAEDWVQFRIGSGLLCLRPFGRSYDGQAPAPNASVQLSFRVAPNAVDVAYQELRNASVDIVESPEDKPFGHRTLYFRDPEHNIIEIYAEI